MATGFGTQPYIEKNATLAEQQFIDFVPTCNWPPNLPGLNPMDFFVWGVIERCTNKIPCKTKDKLIKLIKKEFKAMKKAQIMGPVRGRIEAVIDAKGDFIE